MQNEDLAVEVLLMVQRQIAPELDEALLRRCYDVQKRHQFDRDRSVPYRAMEDLVEDYVDALLADNHEVRDS